MEQIYDFEQHRPPVLNENMLRAEQERHELRWQTALVALAGIMMQVAILTLGLACIELEPLLTAFALAYVAISSTGAGVLAIVYTRKGGVL